MSRLYYNQIIKPEIVYLLVGNMHNTSSTTVLRLRAEVLDSCCRSQRRILYFMLEPPQRRK